MSYRQGMVLMVLLGGLRTCGWDKLGVADCHVTAAK